MATPHPNILGSEKLLPSSETSAIRTLQNGTPPIQTRREKTADTYLVKMQFLLKRVSKGFFVVYERAAKRINSRPGDDLGKPPNRIRWLPTVRIYIAGAVSCGVRLKLNPGGADYLDKQITGNGNSCPVSDG